MVYLSYIFIGLGIFLNVLSLLFLKDSYKIYFQIIRMMEVEMEVLNRNMELNNINNI